MIRQLALVVALVVALVAPASADERDPFAWSHGRPIADWLSTIGVGTSIAFETIHNAHAENRSHAWTCQAMRTGLALVGAETAKRLIARWRPDGSDQQSFYSEHTTLAEVNSGWSLGVAVAIGVGYGRMAAAKHHASDVAVGFATGWLARKVCE